MNKRRRMGLLLLALAMLVCASLACDDDTTVETVVEDTDSIVSEDVEEGLDVINDVNCKLGLGSCVTDTVEAEIEE